MWFRIGAERLEVTVEALALSPDVLNWAVNKAGETLQSFAHSLTTRETSREHIVSGRLTVPQAETLAKKARIPFGWLFLHRPPVMTQPDIPDLRQPLSPMPLSNDFWETLQDIQAKQEWLIEHLSEVGARALPFVGRFANATLRNADDIANDIRLELRLTDADRTSSHDAGAYFSTLSAKAEACGILVFKASHVKSNTRQTLSEHEFRGFALAHPLVPVVFVNGHDAASATVFTLAHELAHIWIGETGVSDVVPDNKHHIERLCNRVAAELLVPTEMFLEQWRQWEDVAQLARYFRVSRLVIARRALDHKLVDQAFYERQASMTDERVKASRSAGGPSALVTIPVRNSKRFTGIVVANAMSGKTMLRDAASLLNVQPNTVVKLAGKMGSA